MDFAVPVDHREKIKESEKRNEYFDLAGVLKKVWNMRVRVIPFVIGPLGTFPRDSVRKLEELEIGE